MTSFTNTVLLTYATLFPLINPVGDAPIFLSLTQSHTKQARNSLAWRVAVNCFILLLASLLIGSYVLEFFGISLPIVRLGGGIVVAALGWNLLNSGAPDHPDSAASTRKLATNDAFYPYTMPLTVGPGSISAAIALGSQRPGSTDVSQWLQLGSASILGIFAVSVTIFLCYRFAEGTVRRLGPGGTNVVVRMSAFILLCIGLQIFWTGWSALMSSLHLCG